MASVEFTTQADRWPPGGERVTITIRRDSRGVTVNWDPVAVTYNGIQLRLNRGEGGCQGHHIVFDDRHNPPRPIAEMYEELTG